VSLNKSAWLAWALCGLGVALALAGPVITLREAGSTAGFAGTGQSVVSGLISIVFGLVGALIVSRQPRQTIGWLVLIVGPSFSFGTVLDQWSQMLPATAALTPLTMLLLWLGGWNWWLLVGPLLLIPMLFPTGRLLSPRWRWAVALLAGSFAFFLLSGTFSPTVTLPHATTPVRNPVGFLPGSVAQFFFGLFEWSLPAAAICSAAAAVIRYRRAGAVERQQIKWVLYAGALFVLAFVLQFITASDSSGGLMGTVVGVLFGVGILSIPLSIGIAILRYRLWDIDILIRRTLLYAVLTGLLAFAYFASVVVLQNTFAVLTGQRQSALVTVLSTLVIAALFVPLRARVQAEIDRRLYRRKYDAARTLAAFGSKLRDEVELAVLTEQLLNVVDDTMQPASVGLWLRAPERKQS
jgi:hypothetical protein